jgi:crossover junction endodeoxyribonuclease RuvC
VPAGGVVKIIGIDPGLAATGIGIVHGRGMKVHHFAYGIIRTLAHQPQPDRLARIYQRLCGLLNQEAPDLMVVEDAYSLDRYPKSGLTLAKVTGVILLAGRLNGLAVAQVAVREAKAVLTGNGNAGKSQMEGAVRQALHLAAPIRPDHASDALGMALVGLFRYGHLLSAGPTTCGLEDGGPPNKGGPAR